MKKLLFILMLVIGSVSMSSCITGAYAETSICGDDVEWVIRFGTPYYYDDVLVYYFYDGFYFYPYYYNNVWTFRRYARPLPPPRHHIHGYTTRPHRPNGHRPNPPRSYYGHVTPHNPPSGMHGNHVSHPHNPPSGNHGNVQRPSTQPRSSNGHVTHHNPPVRSGGFNGNVSRPSIQSRPSPSMSRPSGSPNSSFGRSGGSSGPRSTFGGRR